jgi:hypothetical protein
MTNPTNPLIMVRKLITPKSRPIHADSENIYFLGKILSFHQVIAVRSFHRNCHRSHTVQLGCFDTELS